MVTQKEYNRVLAAKRKAEKGLLRLQGVHGVSLGYKNTGGTQTDDLAICVHLSKKRARNEILNDELIPKEIDGVKTDVLEHAAHILGGEDDSVYRPLRGGCKIVIKNWKNRKNLYKGTLGAIARGRSDRDYYLLSCSHVLFAGKPKDEHTHEDSTYVGQPDVDDTDPNGKKVDTDNVGATVKGVDNEHVDAAIASIANPVSAEGYVIDIGRIAGTYVVQPTDIGDSGYPVKKRGMTTRLSSGYITNLNYSGTTLGGRVFTDQMFIRIYCDVGDSGSLIVDDLDRAVGLLWGVDPDDQDHGVASSIDLVTDELDIDIATEHLRAGMIESRCERDQKRVKDELSSTEQGKDYLALFQRHWPEIKNLIKNEASFQDIWKKNDGDKIIQSLIERVRDPSSPPAPAILHENTRIKADRLIDALIQYGSEELKHTVETLTESGFVDKYYAMSWDQVRRDLQKGNKSSI